MPEHERRRHQRYSLRLSIKVRRGQEELDADIINASMGGCLLLMQIPLEKGEALSVKLPQLNLPQASLYVLRCEAVPEGYRVATCFDELATDEDAIREASDEQQAGSKPPAKG